MIDSLPLLSSTPVGASASSAPGAGSGALAGTPDAAVGVVAGAATSFEQTLGQFLDYRDMSVDRALLPPASDKGQKPAADGKDLPAADSDDPSPDASVMPAWFPAFVAPPPLYPPPVSPPPASLSPNDADAAAAVPAGRAFQAPSRSLLLASTAQPAAPPDAADRVAQNMVADSIDGPAPARPLMPDFPLVAPADRAAPMLATGATRASAMVALDFPRSAPSVSNQAAADAVPADSARPVDGRPALATVPALPTLLGTVSPLPAAFAAGRAAIPQPGPTSAGPASLAPQPVTGQGAVPATAPPAVVPAALAAVTDSAVDRTAPTPAENASAAPAPVPAAAAAVPAAGDASPKNTITVSTTPQPAGQVFAAAIATATSWRDRAVRSAVSDAAALAPSSPIAQQDRAIVHVAADAQGSALDLTKDSGLQRMIDRIETLRDDKDAGDTRIRLVPDALGSVDIAVRQEGDRVHVRFTAEQDATRALLADAQPRLTDLAAARGVRIGQTSVSGEAPGGSLAGSNFGGGAMAGGNNAPPQPRPTPQLARAPRGDAADTASPDDQRLA